MVIKIVRKNIKSKEKNNFPQKTLKNIKKKWFSSEM